MPNKVTPPSGNSGGIKDTTLGGGIIGTVGGGGDMLQPFGNGIPFQSDDATRNINLVAALSGAQSVEERQPGNGGAKLIAYLERRIRGLEGRFSNLEAVQ